MAELVMRLPAITTEMDEGTLLTWMVEVGQAVKEGDPICEFTTDKVDTELESPYTGTITKLIVPEGGSVRVGDAIALINGDSPNFLGDLDSAFGAAASNGSDEPKLDAVSEADGEAAGLEDAPEDTGVVPAPRAVRLEAIRRGIDLANVTPTGSRGQVTMADLDTYATSMDTTSPGSDAIEGAEVLGTELDSAMVHDPTEAEVDQPEHMAETTPGGGNDHRAEGELNKAPVLTAIVQPDENEDGEPSLAAQRPQERRGRRAERTGGHRRGRRRQVTEEPRGVGAVVSESEPVTVDPAITIGEQMAVHESAAPAVPSAPVIHEVRVESAPPITLYAQLDVTDLHTDQENGLAMLSRLTWAYGQALWEQPEANAIWDNQDQMAVLLDTVYVDLGIETISSTLETVPIAVPKDAPIAQIGLLVTNAYDLIRKGTSPEDRVTQRSATLIDLGPWRVERFTPVIQPPQVTALSVGAIQTVPSLVGRTVTIRQLVTIGLTIDTRVLDPVQAATLLATITDLASRGDGLA